MEQWSGERAYVLKLFYNNNDIYVACACSFRLHFILNYMIRIPSAMAIKIWITNFEETDLVLKK